MWGDIAIAFLLAFITAYVITPYTIRLAKKIGALDLPKDKRKIHKNAMPRLGGLAVIIGFIVSTIYLLIVMSIEQTIILTGPDNYYTKLIGFFLGGFILAIFCFIDDWKGIPPYVKLIGQILAALVVTFSGIRIDKISLSYFNTIINDEIISSIITIIWIVGITNAINLIDGLDGLSSGICLISCISLLIIFTLNSSPLIAIILITALAGSLVGFLPYNFNPAKTFIGDTGSNFLGYALSIISILGVAKTYTAIVLIAPLIVFALPLFDTISAILRRIIKTKSLKGVFKADREHLHHKIMKRGYTQKQAVFILYGMSASFGMFAIILLESGIWKALSFGLMIIAIIAIGYKDILKLRKEEDIK
ncbi:MAG: MraY family glycosyltransferase [Clostridia bacterium]|nr:MraY family glycosyltransferase [Clostridia bacterium]